MRQVIIGVVGFGLAIGIGWAVSTSIGTTSSSSPTTGQPDTKPDWQPEPLPMVEPPSTARGRIPATEVIAAKNGHEQILWVDALPEADELTAAECTSLMAIMQTKGLLPVTRNNIANRLVARQPMDPVLADAFIAMYRDETEDRVWRDYSIQFLSVTVHNLSGEDQQKAAGYLRDVGRSDTTTIGATALLQEARLVREEVLTEQADYSTVLGQRLADPATDGVVKHTMLALIGEDSRSEHVDLVRQQLASPLNDDVKRGALYAIGRLGTSADVAAIEPFMTDKNPGVVKAAEAALARLRAEKETP